MVWGNFLAYIAVLGRTVLGLPAAQIGYLLAVQSIANGVARVPAGLIVDRFQNKLGLIAAALAIYAAGQMVLPHLTGFWLPAALLAATVPAIATGFTAIAVEFAHMARDGERGAVMGVYTSAQYLGLGLGPAIFAPLMNRGFVVGFTVAGLMTFAAVTLLVLARRGTGAPSSELAAASTNLPDRL
jgi:sugar phosphate permease